MQDSGYPNIKVGSLVTARFGLASVNDLGETDTTTPNGMREVADAGESGVCFGLFETDEQSLYGFIFQRGGYDLFTPEDVSRLLEVGGSVSKSAAKYQYQTAHKLKAGYHAGRFDEAFEEQNIETAHERSGIPHLRDVLRREHDDNLRRAGAGLEPRRDVDVDLDR